MPTSDSHTCQLLKVARAMARFALAVLLLLCARALADEGCASDGTCHADEDENAALLQKSAAHKATVTEHMHTNATVGCGPFDLGCECTGKNCKCECSIGRGCECECEYESDGDAGKVAPCVEVYSSCDVRCCCDGPYGCCV